MSLNTSINNTSKKILFLGPEDSPLIPWLREQGVEVFQTEDKISTEMIVTQGFSFLVSYGYRHILQKDILDLFPDKAINLHISYLPWNRGADPNFWSFVEDTPQGVTIHYLDEGVDTGDIIVQKKVEFDFSQDTLSTSYDKLHVAIQELFKQNWHNIVTGSCQRKKQTGDGSRHNTKDKETLFSFLEQGWNTPVSVLNKKRFLSLHNKEKTI